VLVGLPGNVVAQDRRVSGRVTRAGTTDAVAAAEVSIVGQPRFAPVVTNAEGRFTIAAPAGDFRLQVRALGFARAEVPVAAGTNNVDVALTEDVFKLEEVVVTGQATSVARRSATTSVAYVSGDEVSAVPAATALNAIQGKIAGVNLQTNSGAPGGGIQMQIRGNNTILGAYDPLFVVDGVIYSNTSIPSGRGLANNAASPSTEADAVNRIADLNPADIASIEVLKGAAASSIYGSKAANGVVVITTTRGAAGAPSFTVTQRLGMATPLKLLESRRWSLDSAIATFGEAARPFFEGNNSPYYDQYAQVYSQRGLSYETLADVRGGTATTRYYVSGANRREEGIERNTGASRQSLRANLDQLFGARVDMKVSMVYAHNENDRGWNNNCNNYGCHGYAIAYTPSFINYERRNPDGTYPAPTVGPQSNPLQLTELGVNHEETNRFTGGVTFGWSAFTSEAHNLRVVAGGGIDVFDQRNDVWTPNELFFEIPQSLPGESIESGGRSFFTNWNVNGIHTWNGASWSATTAAGLQYEDRRLTTFQIRAQNLLPGQRNVNQGTNVTGTENLSQERTLALYLQEDLRLLDDRLLFQTGLRAERSSVNGDVDKYYIFPKVSSSYRLIDVLGAGSELKFRAAYGETGNQPLFGQKFTNLATPQLGGQQGIAVSTASGFADVEPERLKEIEAGIDGFGMGGRLTWELTWFTRNTTNLLLQRVPAPSSGFATQTFNGGRIRNTGAELAIGFSPIQTPQTQWLVRGTFTRYTSEVEDLAGLPAFFPASSGFGNLGRTRIEVGKSLTQIVGFRYLGNGEISETLEELGNSAPDFRVGFLSGLSYKSMNLDIVADWQQGGDVINLQQYLRDHGKTSPDYETPEGRRREEARRAGAIDPYIEDGSFVKLREVSIGVDVPTRYLGPLNTAAKSLRVGLSGRNLFMWTKYSGLDPEVGNFGAAAIRNNLDIGAYPPSRSFYFNVTVGF